MWIPYGRIHAAHLQITPDAEEPVDQYEATEPPGRPANAMVFCIRWQLFSTSSCGACLECFLSSVRSHCSYEVSTECNESAVSVSSFQYSTFSLQENMPRVQSRANSKARVSTVSRRRGRTPRSIDLAGIIQVTRYCYGTHCRRPTSSPLSLRRPRAVIAAHRAAGIKVRGWRSRAGDRRTGGGVGRDGDKTGRRERCSPKRWEMAAGQRWWYERGAQIRLVIATVEGGAPTREGAARGDALE